MVREVLVLSKVTIYIQCHTLECYLFHFTSYTYTLNSTNLSSARLHQLALHQLDWHAAMTHTQSIENWRPYQSEQSCEPGQVKCNDT